MARFSFDTIRKLQQEARAILQEAHAPGTLEGKVHPMRYAAHFCALVWNSFFRNRCFVRAAALAYTSVLALVPLLAVAASVMTTFLTMDESHLAKLINDGILYVAPALSLTNRVSDTLLEVQGGGTNAFTVESAALPGPTNSVLKVNPTNTVPAEVLKSAQEEAVAISSYGVAEALTKAIQQVNAKTLGISSTLSLLFLAISLLSTIEDAFNDMWGVLRGRTWVSRVVQYWAALTLGPILVGVAITLTSASQFERTKAWIENVPALGNLTFIILPYVIWSVGCALFYLLIPNAQVNWKAALAGGVVAGCVLQLNNKLSVLYYSRVVMSYKLYGTIAAIPVFLVGLYFSWVILLLGGQVAYAVQNWRAYAQEKQAERINQRGREFIAFRMMTLIGERFASGQEPPACSALAHVLGIPLRLVMKVSEMLVRSRLLVQTAGEECGLAPARPLERISAHDILEALRAGAGEELATVDDPARQQVRSEFEAIQRAEERASSAVSVQMMVDRARPAQLVEPRQEG